MFLFYLFIIVTPMLHYPHPDAEHAAQPRWPNREESGCQQQIMPDVREALDAILSPYRNTRAFERLDGITNELRIVSSERAKSRDQNGDFDEDLRETRDKVVSAAAKYHIQARGVRYFNYSVNKKPWEHKGHICRAIILLVRAGTALPIFRGHEKHISLPMIEAGHTFALYLIKEEVSGERAQNWSHLAKRRERVLLQLRGI
jgi:hypothetical protein